METYYQKNKEGLKLYAKRYYEEHKEEKRKYNQSHVEERKKYYQTHKEKYKEYSRKQRLQNKDKISAQRRTRYLLRDNHTDNYNKERLKKIRRQVISYYSNSKNECACCGEKIFEFLCIDHINGNGAKHRKEDGTASNICVWLIKHNYPKGFQVLCRNCNWGKGQRQLCPHKRKVV